MPLFKESAKGLVFRQQDQGGREPPPVGSVGIDQLKDEVRFGLVPVGSVIAVMSHLSGVASLPASGVASNGWMRCDGSVIPSGQTLSGTLPDLTSGRFIYGTSGAGAGNNPLSGGTGGTNSVTITSANLPTHTHTIDHTHSAGTISGTAASANTDHYHNYQFSTSYKSPASDTLLHDNVSRLARGENGGSTNTWSSDTGTMSSNTTHSHSVSGSASIPGFSGSSGNGGFANTALNITPSYVAAVYLIRVK